MALLSKLEAAIARGRLPLFANAGLAGMTLAAALLVVVIVLRGADKPAPETLSVPPVWGREPIAPVPERVTLDPRRVQLGAILFADKRLSGSGTMSCASCHDLSTNGAASGPQRTRTDTPTVFNVALNFRFGWEGKDRTLEEQARTTLAAPLIAEDVPVAAMVARLREDAGIARRFRAIYGRPVDEQGVVDALATFERSLITPNSRFDRWLRGESNALNARALRGYALFKRLGCVACHQGRNIGGNLRQRHGIFRPLASPEPAILRVPSLRNVAETAPYFHDGSAPTLESAVTRMANAQLNLKLSAGEARDIAHFLRSLTGTYNGKPVQHPR